MTSTLLPPQVRVNPVHGFAGAALSAVRRVADAPAWAMSRAELAETLLELSALEGMVAELKLRVLAEADKADVAGDVGASSTAAWVAHRTRVTRRAAGADVRLAKALDVPVMETLRHALAAGRVNLAQARVIAAAVADLPVEVPDGWRVRAQQHLVGEAQVHDAKQLKVLGRKIFEVLAPDEADARESEILEAEERVARERCSFATRDNGDGTTNGWFRLPTAQASMLVKAVHAFAAPRRVALKQRRLTESAVGGGVDGAADGTADGGVGPLGPTGGQGVHVDGWVQPDGRPVPWSVQLGQAFGELVEHLPVDGLPQAGGLGASVLITMDLDKLTSGLGSGVLDTGEVISAGQVRRLACGAGLVPVVLGSDSEVLDVGREARLHSKPMRKGAVVRDKECTTEGCDRPAAWCELHHPKPWSKGGVTSVENSRLLCPRHHHYAHDDRYDMRELPSGQVRFARRH